MMCHMFRVVVRGRTAGVAQLRRADGSFAGRDEPSAATRPRTLACGLHRFGGARGATRLPDLRTRRPAGVGAEPVVAPADPNADARTGRARRGGRRSPDG